MSVPVVERTVISFRVHGIPQPQGSMRSFVVNGRARTTHVKGGTLAVWRHAVTEMAARRWGERAPLDCPVALSVQFFMPKPASTPKKARWVKTQPDLDKLVRAVCDSLEGVVLTNDARVVSIHATKTYAVTEGAGALIRLETVL